MVSLILTRYWWVLCALLGAAFAMAFIGCATAPEKVDTVTSHLQALARKCDPHGGVKRIEVEEEYVDIWCRSDRKGFRVWYAK